MISLIKGKKPTILETNAVTWTQDYLTAQTGGGTIPSSIRYRYRHADIKVGLIEEAYGKCVYCERKVPFGETDHFLPISHRPDLIVEWDNLVLSCKECNMYKRDYYDVSEPLLNPFQDDPCQYLTFYGPMILSHVGNQTGFRTIEQLQLSRMELFERRKERLELLQGLLEQWNSLPEGSTKNIAKRKIIEEAENDKEFSASTKAFLYQSMGW